MDVSEGDQTGSLDPLVHQVVGDKEVSPVPWDPGDHPDGFYYHVLLFVYHTRKILILLLMKNTLSHFILILCKNVKE